MKENWFLLFCILPSMYCILTENVESLGCWKESKKSSLVSFENKHHFLTGPYNKRKSAVEKCARVAIDHGFTVFALQNGGKCLSGANGIKRFNMYGPSNLCKDGKGGPWSNNVYSTKTFHTRSFSSLRDETPWDAYCTRPLDIVVLMDGSGNINEQTKKRWVLIKNFVKKFIRGFDDHTRIGIIQYGENPEIIQDIKKPKSKENLDITLEKAELPGGERTLNDALKRAWREQLKETNRTNADKIILATTTGDIPYGLYGSSQFLSDHNVRIVVVGIDKYVHYEFLQSVASYHDVGNIFSVNSGQLDDVAPYIYRDICNNMPEYVLATTPTPSKERPINQLKRKNTEVLNSKTKENLNNNFSDVKSSKPSRTASAKSRGDIPPFARENYDDFDGPSVNKIVDSSKILNDVTSKKHLITAVRNGTSKEKVATMVLINPSPDVFLGLTPNEAKAIENRHNPSNEEMEPNTFLPKVSLKNQDSPVNALSEAKNINKTTESLDHSKMFTLDSLNDKVSSESDDQWEELAPVVINEETNTFKKLDNLNENENLSEISGGKSGKSLENPKLHSMLKMKNKQVNSLQVKKPNKLTSKINETKSRKIADKVESKKDPHVVLDHPVKEPEHPVKGIKSQYFPVKLFSNQGHEPPDGLKITNGNQNVGSNTGNEAKVSDLNIHGLGALSQTLELHAGNGKEHVSYHPSFRKAHQSLFTDKLKDRMKEPHSMFAGKDEAVTTQERKGNKQPLKSSKRLADFANASLLLNSAGKNLAEIYLQIHKAERTNLEMPNTVEGFLGKKGNVYTNTNSKIRSDFTTRAAVAGKTIATNAYENEGKDHSSKFLKDKITNDQSIKKGFHRSQLTQGSFSFNKSVSPAEGIVNLIKNTVIARKKFYIDQGNNFGPFLIGADYNEGLGFDSQSDILFFSEKRMMDINQRSQKKIKNNASLLHSINNLVKNKQKFVSPKKVSFFTNITQLYTPHKKPLIPPASKRYLPTSPLKNGASSVMSSIHKKTLHTLSIDNLKLLDNDAVVHGNIRIDGSKVNFITEEINRTKSDILNNSMLENHFSDINLSEKVNLSENTSMKTENISERNLDSGQLMNTTSSRKKTNSSEVLNNQVTNVKVHHNSTENQRDRLSLKSKYQFRDEMDGRDNSNRNNTTQFHKVSYKLENKLNDSYHMPPTNITKKEKNIARLNELLNTFEKHFKNAAKNNNISLFNGTADGYLNKDVGGHIVFPKNFYNAHIKNPQIIKAGNNGSKAVNEKPTIVKMSNVKPTNVKPTNVKPSNVKPSNVKPTNVKPSLQIESYKGKTSKTFINRSKGKKFVSNAGKGKEIMLMKNFDANIQKYNHNILDKISLLVNAMKPVMNAHIDFKSQGEEKLGVNKDFSFKIGDPSATSTPYKPTSSPKPKTTSRPTTTPATTIISTTTSTTVFAVQFGYQYNPATGTGFILPNTHTIPNIPVNNASAFENPQNIPGFVINNVSGDLTQINNNNNFGNLTNPNIAIPSSDGKVYLPGNYEISAKKEKTAHLVVPSYTTSLSSKRNDQAVKGPSIGFQSNIRTLTQDTFQPLNQMIKKFYKSGDIHQVIDIREPNLDDAVDELNRVMDDRVMDNVNYKGTNSALAGIHPLLNNNHVAVLKPSDQHATNSTIDSEFDSSPVISQQQVYYRPLANVHNNKLRLFKNVPYLENTAKVHEMPVNVNHPMYYDTLEPGVHNNSIEEETFSQAQQEILPQPQYQNHEELNSQELYSVEPEADMQGENRPLITVNANHGVFHNTSHEIQEEDLFSAQPGGGVHETVNNDNEPPKLASSLQQQHEIVSENNKAGSFSGPDEWYHIRVSQNRYHRKHPQVITYKQAPILHSINNHAINIQKQSSHYVANNPLMNQVPINEGENIVHEHEHAADGLNMHYKHHKGFHHLQTLAHTLHQPQDLKKVHMDLIKQEHTKLKYSYLGMNTLERKHRLKVKELNKPFSLDDHPRVISKHFKHNGFPMFYSSFKDSKHSRNSKAYVKFKRMRQPTLPHPPEIDALPSMPNFITNHLSYKPRLNRPIYPIMTPHAAPDSHSILRHEKKGSISASRLMKRVLDEKKWAAMQLLNQNINGKFLHGRERVAEIFNQTKEIEYTKLPLSNAWTEADFLPKKGPPLFRTNKTFFVYQSPKERETIAKTLQKILWINALVGRKGNEEAKLHHDKHASFKAYLLHELENYEKNAENQSVSRAVDRSASPKNVITHNSNPPHDLSYETLKKSFWVSKTAGPFEEHNVYHVATRDKLNKQEAVNHLSTKDQNPFSNTTGLLKDYDIMYLENTDSVPKNIIDETSSDGDLMKFTSQERIMKNAEKRTNQAKGEKSAKDMSSLMKQKSAKQLNFDDFPRSFLIKDFNLGDMPSLPVGKSYVLSTPSIGTVTVRIKNDLSDESEEEKKESNSNHKKNRHFTKTHRKKFEKISYTNKDNFVKQSEKNENEEQFRKKEKFEDKNDEQSGENEEKMKIKVSSTKPKVFLNERNRLVAVPDNVLYGRKYGDDDEDDSKENNETELKAQPTNSLMESGENIPEENKDNREILGNSEGKNVNNSHVNEAELTDMVHAVLKNIVNESKAYMMNLINSDKAADYVKDFLNRNHESKNLTEVIIQNTTFIAPILQGRKRNNNNTLAVNKNLTSYVISTNATLVNNSLRVEKRNKSVDFESRISENISHKNISLDNITRSDVDKTDSGIRDDIYVTTKMSNAFNLTIDKIPEENLKKTFSNNTFMRMTALEYMLGCTKPLRILYAIDVSDGLGDGFVRKKKWNRLKDFISDINSGLFKDVRSNYMVYNIEPRFMESLDGCDRNTEYFLTADDCLCGTNPLTRSAKAGCSVNGPTQQESVEDWGAHGPRTGRALDIARTVYFKENLNLFKNVIFLISHKESTDNLKMAEMNLKKDGISLVDIELGDRHDLRKKHYIPEQRNYRRSTVEQRNYRRSNSEENALDEHKVKVSLKKLQQTLRNIVGRVCKSQTDEGI